MSILIRNIRRVFFKTNVMSVAREIVQETGKSWENWNRKLASIAHIHPQTQIQYINIKFALIYPYICRSMHVGKRLLYVYSLFFLLTRTNWRYFLIDTHEGKKLQWSHWWVWHKSYSTFKVVCKLCKEQYVYQSPCRTQTRLYYKLKTYLFLALLPLQDLSNLL